jgi:hypothetical protein
MNIKETLKEILESMEDQSSNWTLPPGSNQLIKSQTGHLSVVHTSLLQNWVVKIQEILQSLD